VDIAGNVSYADKMGWVTSAQAGYGAKIDLGDVDVEVKFNQSFMPKTKPDNTWSADTNIQAGRWNIGAGATLWTHKNINGSLPYGLRLNLSYTLK
jgi:hypothetical protein